MNLKTTLDTIDRSLTSHRQQIALHQVEIARLEDARRVLIGLGEEASPEMQRAIALKAEAGSPLLIVREPGSANHSQVLATKEERQKERLRLREHKKERRDYKREYHRRKAEEKRRIATEYGAATPAFERQRALRSDAGKPREPGIGGSKAKGTGKKAQYLARIREIMADGQQRFGTEIMEALGPLDRRDKQSVYNSLSYLKLSTGELRQEHFGGPYTLVRKHVEAA